MSSGYVRALKSAYNYMWSGNGTDKYVSYDPDP